jgi:DmsE family decaheme c-type cytochrome
MVRLSRLGSLSAFMLLWAAAAAARQGATVKTALAADEVCTTCHNETWAKPILSIYQTPHGNRADARAPGCRSCHGPSEGHLADFNTSPDVVFGAASKKLSKADVQSAACLACHDSKVLPRMNWVGSQHEGHGVACTSCHNIHAPDQKVLNRATQAEVCFTCHKAQRAQIRRISSHPLAVTGIGSPPKMVCSDCHNPHGSTGPSLLVKNSVNETCYTCHAEKRGPFLWEHSPVVDSCVNCHSPHGSTNAALLKVRAPFLCQECHSGDHGAQINSGANLGAGAVTTVNGLQQPGAAAPRAQLAARACLNCHVLIHGSNHPAGAKFQR